MIFSSMVFLWIFLPVVWLSAALLFRFRRERWTNLFLFLASLFFYAWGEPAYILLMLFSVVLNYCGGLWLVRGHDKTSKKRRMIAVLSCDLLLLGVFKYLGLFAGTVFGLFGAGSPFPELPLPIGISFYTFQAMSYIIDLYRGRYEVQRNLFRLGLYIAFFPQLIAGPIVRYEDFEKQLVSRSVTTEKTAAGIRRFCYGLAKKVLLANTLAEGVERITTAATYYGMSAPFLWLMSVMYTLQIYYDFSGYSDMAIGLGKLFGFEFRENFRLPYCSKSIGEFWRRWHISLGTWFREYVYIPLGGNRGGKKKTCRNLLIVFALTGFWHGAEWGFLLWGLYYGILIVAERLTGLERHTAKHPFFGWLYTMIAVNFGWVVFAFPQLKISAGYLKRMILFPCYLSYAGYASDLVNARLLVAVVIGILGAGVLQHFFAGSKLAGRYKGSYAEDAVCALLFFAGVCVLATGGYNPFIYFRF